MCPRGCVKLLAISFHDERDMSTVLTRQQRHVKILRISFYDRPDVLKVSTCPRGRVKLSAISFHNEPDVLTALTRQQRRVKILPILLHVSGPIPLSVRVAGQIGGSEADLVEPSAASSSAGRWRNSRSVPFQLSQ